MYGVVPSPTVKLDLDLPTTRRLGEDGKRCGLASATRPSDPIPNTR